MSQQINLLNPDLRPRQDWLAFAVVAPSSLAVLALVLAGALWLHAEQRTLVAQESALAGEVKATQERLQAAAKAGGERKSDPLLAREAQRLEASLQWRREALRLLQVGGFGETTGFSAFMKGLARQTLEGLWLTAFAIKGGEVELGGRMLDPALLPVYIRRLNTEPGFIGRRFAELSMTGVPEQKQAKPAAGAASPSRLPPHTEFALRSVAADRQAPKNGDEQ